MSSALPIIVFTTSTDLTSPGVVSRLNKKRQDVIVFVVDKIIDGSVTFSTLIKNGKILLTYDNRTIDLNDIGSAWCWHPDVDVNHVDHGYRTAIQREMRQTFYGLYEGIASSLWMSPPLRIYDAQNKASQMIWAQDVGFVVPPTTLTNTWKSVDELGSRTIIKMPLSGSVGGDHSSIMSTIVLDKKLREKIEGVSPFPGMHQPYVAKKREWRITVVGEKVFPVAIYTEASAKDDWRKHQHENGKVIFKSEPLLDRTIEKKCRALLKKLGLRYGAFDFIETPDGDMVFLEVNSAGQYGWLEDQLGLPISEAIAELLIEIAESQC